MSADPDPSALRKSVAEPPLRSEAPTTILSHAVFSAGSPSADGDVPSASMSTSDGVIWRALCIGEITNFGNLRRQFGREWADRLADAACRRIADARPHARVSAIARGQIEVAFACESPQAASIEIAALQQLLHGSVESANEVVHLDVIFGAAAAAQHDDDDVQLIEAAESALEQARTEGKVVMRDLSRPDLALDRLTLMRELPRAIAAGEMFLHYQPKMHVRRQVIASAEALVRWQHPTRGLIMPGDFISVAEESGAIGPLTLSLLRRVIADQRTLTENGHDFPIFLNISGVSLADKEFIDEACRIITASDARIGFEITETSVIRDPEVAIRHLQRLAEIGVILAIDDYGAGLSSLAYLKQLPAAELKIDKMFVMQLTSSNRDPLIVRSTIDLAHALEMEVTAEGVETPSALALLSVMGCDMVQGYLISRPLNFEAFQQYLEAEQHLVAAPSPQLSFKRPETFWKRA